MTAEQIYNAITPELKAEMETIWFTADLHSGHPKIVDICNRPVYLPKDQIDYLNNHVGENMKPKEYKRLLNPIHDNWLVKEIFNKYVKKRDDVFILGDLSMAKREEAEKFIDRLNGNKFLILGNHDNNIKTSTRFTQITQIKTFRFKRPGLVIYIELCHYPMGSWNRKVHGAWHLYGHVHGRYKQDGLALDVGIDNSEVNYRPINLYEVAEIMYEKEKHLDLTQLKGVDYTGID